MGARSILILALLAAVASEGAHAGSPVDVEQAIRERGLDPGQIVVPDRITAEMVRWVHEVVPARLPPSERVDRLMAAVLSPSGLDLVYEAGATATAAEVFRDRRANCLGFSFLIVGLARELGVEAFYLEVEEVRKYARVDDLVLVTDHVTVGFGGGPDLRVLEFAGRPVETYRRVSRLSEIGSVALYYSNRGGELLVRGQAQQALPLLEQAVAVDPAQVRAWVNLGVARRRVGDLEGAEDAFRQATATDPDEHGGFFNLALLLRSRGDRDAAEELLRLLERRRSKNPYTFLVLGDLSLGDGSLEQAHRFYRRAARRAPDEAEPKAALGLWAARAGRLDEARRWLARAQAIDAENGRVRQLARALTESS